MRQLQIKMKVFSSTIEQRTLGSTLTGTLRILRAPAADPPNPPYPPPPPPLDENGHQPPRKAMGGEREEIRYMGECNNTSRRKGEAGATDWQKDIQQHMHRFNCPPAAATPPNPRTISARARRRRRDGGHVIPVQTSLCVVKREVKRGVYVVRRAILPLPPSQPPPPPFLLH